jgi:endonuclease/exonuclease/phosphatase (EEP) superfamily protein YafD
MDAAITQAAAAGTEAAAVGPQDAALLALLTDQVRQAVRDEVERIVRDEVSGLIAEVTTLREEVARLTAALSASKQQAAPSQPVELPQEAQHNATPTEASESKNAPATGKASLLARVALWVRGEG